MKMKYILSVDQSTSGTKAVLVDHCGVVARKASKPHSQFHPMPGRVEHDASEIWNNVQLLINEVWTEGIQALAITNQRETTVVWDRATGEPVCPAVVWQDVRGEALCRSISFHADEVLKKTGLTLSPYYPAAKLATVLRERTELRARAESGELCAGTIESYLIYRLTGGAVFATDVSNASRTQLLNLSTLRWDDELLQVFSIPRSVLAPVILHSDAAYGDYRGIPITGVLGDSHASLFGHGCHASGQVKASYGTGSSIMLNVGEQPVFSRNGLSASVGFGYRGSVCYVLEGNVTCSADTLVWLKDGLQALRDIGEAENIARTVLSTDGVQLVPAFSGLGAPYFDSNARAILCGMSRGTTLAHVVRAALESIAQQNADILDAMALDTGSAIENLSADGGGSVNRLLMQLQADLVPCRVSASSEADMTALGAALMAGLTVGLYSEFKPISYTAVYEPNLGKTQRNQLRAAWADAVRRAR